jgi:hypothetical protein
MYICTNFSPSRESAAKPLEKGSVMVTIAPNGLEITNHLRAVAPGLPAPLIRSGLVSGRQLQGWQDTRETIPSGFAAVDALLPAGGLRRGSLVEWLAGGDAPARDVAGGAGAVSLALAVACRLAITAAGPRTIVVVDRAGWFHPPAVLPWLGGSRQLVVARPSSDDDEIWAIDQALRCQGVAAVVAWPRSAVRQQGDQTHAGSGLLPAGRHGAARPRPTAQWTTAMRRWQLAARKSGAVGLLVRPATAAGEPSWAEARLAVSPLPGGTLFERRLRLERIGGAWSGGTEGHVTETLLDLARGREGSPARGAAREFAARHLRERSGRLSASRSNDSEGGVSCRAS